jgi:hypothetical protein
VDGHVPLSPTLQDNYEQVYKYTMAQECTKEFNAEVYKTVAHSVFKEIGLEEMLRGTVWSTTWWKPSRRGPTPPRS